MQHAGLQHIQDSYPAFYSLGEAVLRNCHISDSQYWGYLSLCNMLARLKSLYLHEHGLPPWAEPVQSEVLSWIDERESLWETLEESEYESLPPSGADPVTDTDSVNRILNDQGLVYGAGFGMFQKPLFFIAELKKTEVKNLSGDTVTVISAGKEFIHDMLPAVAARQGSRIIIRTGIFLQFLHYKFHEAMFLRPDHPLVSFFKMQGFVPSDGYQKNKGSEIPDRLERLSADLLPVIVSHEEGEFLSAKVMGSSAEEWSRRVCNASGNKIQELTLRGRKDLLADSVEGGTLDQLIRSRNETGVFFYAFSRDSFQNSLDSDFSLSLKNLLNGRVSLNTEDWSELEGIRESLKERSLRNLTYSE